MNNLSFNFIELRKIICKVFEIEQSEFLSSCKERKLAYARFMFVGFISQYKDCSLYQIAKFCNRKDHTTIIHAKRKFFSLYNTDDNFFNRYNEVECHLHKLHYDKL